MNALAITDHGNLYGALEFYQACRGVGINPIVGYEAYVAPGSRFEKSSGGQGESSYHLTVLAAIGLAFRSYKLSRRLFWRVSSQAADRSGFAGGATAKAHLFERMCVRRAKRMLLSGNTEDEAMARAKSARGFIARSASDISSDSKQRLEIQRQALELSVTLAKRMGLPLVATATPITCGARTLCQDVLLCINTASFARTRIGCG